MKTLLAWLLCAMPLLSLAQTADRLADRQAIATAAPTEAVQGTVLDAETQRPVAGATIRNATTGTISDSLGRFALPPSATWTVTCMGYEPERVAYPTAGMRIRLHPGSIQLHEVQVVALQPGTRLQELPASIGLLSTADLERTNLTTLAPALNTIPGVRMDQATLSEARISIRGSGVRAPFGNRNLRFYLNDIPLTEADGFTRIEALDVATIGRVEVVKGPASSLYGAGTGGVLHFCTRRASYGQQAISLEGMAGSDGLFRLGTRYQTSTSRYSILASAGIQGYDGYRQHAQDRRTFGSFFGEWYGAKGTTSLLFQRTRQDSEIPGALTVSQVTADPRQANAGNVRQRAGRDQIWTRLGLSHRQELTQSLAVTGSAFISHFNLDHPLAFAYLRGENLGFGGRARVDWMLPSLRTLIRTGGEWLVNQTTSKRNVNRAGQSGDLLLDQTGRNQQATLFLQTETQLTDAGMQLVLGLSRSYVDYRITDNLRMGGRDAGGHKVFEPVWSPRVAVAHSIAEALTLRVGASWGFSPPSSSEITGADGSINPNVQAERAVSYELGARGQVWRKRFQYDITVFAFPGRDELIPQTVAQNLTIYTNAGRTEKYGLEIGTNTLFVDQTTGTVRTLRWWTSYAWSDFRFADYRLRNAQGAITADFSGNRFPGVARHTASSGLDITTGLGIYLSTTWLFQDRLPLNDAATDWNEAYQVLNLKLGWQRNLWRDRLHMDLYAGLDNATDSRYSPLVALNARGSTGSTPPYFQPAPGRTWYTGLNLSFQF